MGGYRLYRAGTPYNAVELPDVDYAQSFDTMYIVHQDHPITKLTRASHYSWAFNPVSFGPTLAAPATIDATAITPNTDAPNSGAAYFPQAASYKVSAVNDLTGQESRASAAVTVTNDLGLKRNYNQIVWGGVTGATFYRIYKSDNGASFGFVGETSALTFRDDNINADLSDAPVVGWNPFDGVGNYPGSVTFFEQRLWVGKTKNAPNAIYGSRSSDFENMDKARPLKADDSLSIACSSGKVNAINQLIPAQSLLALTSDSIFQVKGANDDYLSPSPPPKVVRQNGRGASTLKALLIDNVTFFQPAIGAEIRTLGYSFDIDGFQSNDVSVFSPDFFTGHRIIDWCYAEEPLSVIWAVRDDGKLLAFTWQREQQVWGWTEMEIDGEVTSVCSVPEDGEDRVYLIVKRFIDGEDVYYLEQLASAKWADFRAACYLDCAVSWSLDEARTLFDRLDHLEGKEVWALADGFVAKGLTVENGRVTIPDQAMQVTIGLPMVATVETLPLNFEAAGGASTGTKQTTGRAHLRIVDTLGVTAGRRIDLQEAVVTRDTEPVGMQANLYSGVVRVQMEQVADFETTVVIRQENPLPMRVTAAYLEAKGVR
ncbi:hypothetical protein K3M67_04780 [Sphingobium sp. V4]|uniref:hypothetical protein n=1 Tax=Sphingobium sp. V4 TaxID=3038927 RepID=UPI002558133E|nr:hypothetical protein [Sphingobium sp. V4]WIW89294.1 hypothetical protein K3M67_04780 [Sphingobium sp. V4]